MLDLRLTCPCVGWMIIVALRRSPETRLLPIVAMSADRGLTAEHAAMLSALRVPLLQQPVSLDDLAATIAAAHALAAQCRAPGGQATERPAPGGVGPTLTPAPSSPPVAQSG